jgi:hypothetical protein
MNVITYVASFCFLLLCGTASAEQGDWLVGEWSGVIGNWDNPGSPERFMSIKSIQPNGMATGSWSVTPEKPNKASITVNGEQISVITIANVRVQLKRDGEKLVGTFTLENGKSYPVALTKGSGQAVPAETFAGTVYGGKDCFASSTEMEVTYRGNRDSGNWVVTGGAKINFFGEVTGDTLKASYTTSRGERVTIQTQKRGDTVDASFRGTSGCGFTGKLTRK